MRRLDVGVPPAKLLLRRTEQLLAQQIVFVETTFGSQSSTNILGAVQVLNVPES